MNAQATQEALWTPSESYLASANITQFMEFARSARGVAISDYASLWNWSVENLPEFWQTIWEYFDLDAVSSYERVLGSQQMPGAEWFPGAHLNFADYVLAQGNEDDVAIVGVDETGSTRHVTRHQLRRDVSSLAATLVRLGVQRGDVVAGYLPNIPEAVVAFLATASIGATWSSVGQDYAPSAVVDRFSQLRPVVLVTAEGYQFNGKSHDRTDAVAQIRSGLTSLTHVIMVARQEAAALTDDWIGWREAILETAAIQPVEVPFSHPLWVLFSSGTTGIPKGLVHSHGGILLETLKQMSLHWNLKSDDRLFWYTSPSWVMWNLQVSTLAMGGSIVCYDGSPTYPDVAAMWRLVAACGVTYFGTSPGYLQACEAADVTPGEDYDLSSLRAMGSTGSPLPPHSHRWAKKSVGPIPLWSISGGTDIAGAFLGGVPTVPVWAGELSARCLGVAVDAWNEEGESVTGEVGELVIRKPMPSMPINFWNDEDQSRYRDAYFSVYPQAWRQGDWITITSRGSVVIHGRSDSTLNRNGVRMGSADIYAAVETIGEVEESLVIGAEQSDGSYWMPLFVVPREGVALDEALVSRIKAAIREGASPRHVPDEIIEVSGIPHSKSGKKLEVPVKRLLQGAPLDKVANLDTIDDPARLRQFEQIASRHHGAR